MLILVQVQHLSHCGCGFLLCFLVGVDIDIQRGRYIGVTEKFLNLLDVHSLRQKQTTCCMPLRYNYDKPEKPRISRVFGYLARFFILFQTEKSSREVIIS